ncbi:hypothetical protein HDU79_010081 [Rhizoclosmatium sp. JEL0117]|nr:hypothetical protein HDU79_010081 [Rhizoclosmatium sp. JEL0117]
MNFLFNTVYSAWDSQSLKAKTGVPSIKLALKQDIFNEIAKLVGPTAENYVLDKVFPPLSFKRSLPVVGETQLATMTNITIASFEILTVNLEIQDGFIDISIRDVEIKALADLSALGMLWKDVLMRGIVQVSGKMRFGLANGHCTTHVYDIAVQVDEFKAMTGTGVVADMWSDLMETAEGLLQTRIQESLGRVISRSLTELLDDVLVRNWDVVGSVRGVHYRLAVEFVKEPVISRGRGVEYEIGVDAFSKVGGDAFVKVEPIRKRRESESVPPVVL